MSSATNSSYLSMARTMSHFDLRYAIPILINLIKSQSEAAVSNPYEWNNWDPFHFYINPHQTTWTKLCFTTFMLLLFSATSINVSLTPVPNSTTTHLIRFQVGKFSPHLTLSLVASIVLPRDLFSYAYPAILIFAMCFSSLFFFLGRLLDLINKKLRHLPVWNLHVNSTLTHQLEAEIDIESQAPLLLPQVSEAHVSPEDGDSHAEANDETLVL